MSLVKLRIELEKRIARVVVEACIEKGYFLEIESDPDLRYSQDVNKLMESLFACDDDHLVIFEKVDNRGYRQLGWVRFVYGNSGYDVISDYTTNLDALGVLDRANEIAKQYED